MELKGLFSLSSNRGNILAMVFIRGVSMIISFLYVPLLLNAMETEEYAIWLTLTSIVSWILMLDIGIGNGLRNKLAESLALNKYDDAQSYVSTAYLSIFSIGIVFLILFLCSFYVVDWPRVLNTSSLPSAKINTMVLLVGTSFIFHFELNLINSILLSLQKPAISSMIGCISQVISYICVVIAVKVSHITGLVILGSIISIIPVIVMIITTVIFFCGKYRFLRPNINGFDRTKLKDIFSLGFSFFWIQIITIVLFQTNNIIIAHSVGHEAVVEYNICYKYLYTLVTIFTIVCTPFWSSSTHAYTNNNYEWIKKVSSILNRIAVIFIVVGVLMVIFSKEVYSLWIGKNSPQIPLEINILMLVYCVFMMFYAANGYMINGIGKLRIQMVATTALAIIYVPMSIGLGHYMGLKGILVALVFNAVINSLWSRIQLSKIINQSASGWWLK